MAGPNVDFRISGDEKLFKRALQRSEKEVDKLKGKLKEAGKAGKDSSKQIDEGFGRLKSTIAIVSGAAGVGMLVASFRGLARLAGEVHQEIKGVMTEIKASENVLKNLWQVSETREAYKQATGAQKLIMAREGMTRQESADLYFTLKSLEDLEALPAVATTKRFMDPDVAAKFVATLRAPAAWGKGVGTPEQTIAVLQKAAEKSAFTATQTAEWFPRTVASAKQLGVRPAEVLGVGAAISPLAVRPEMLATQMNRLMETMWKEGYGTEGEGILAGFARWRTEDLEGYLEAKKGNVRFAKAAGALEGAMEEAAEKTAAIESQFTTAAAYYEKTNVPPTLSAIQQSRVAKAQRDIALEPLAMQQMELETAIDRMTAFAAFTGKPLVVEKGWEKLLGKGAEFGLVEQATELAHQRYIDALQEEYPKLYERLIRPAFPAGRLVERDPLGILPVAQMAGRFGPARVSPWANVPQEMSEAQLAAIAAAAAIVAERVISERAGIDAAETKNAVRDGVREGMGNTTLSNPGQEPP